MAAWRPDDPGFAKVAIARVRDWIFEEQRFGLVDVHQCDWDEPAGNGGFLFNGGRCYVDMGHLEYCTPECLSLLDVLRYDQAGDAILLMQAVLQALGHARKKPDPFHPAKQRGPLFRGHTRLP